MTVIETIKSAVTRTVMARTGGLDLTKLDRIPERLSWPLDRNGVVPGPRLARVQENEPVHKLVTFFGIDVWLVTGYAEAREALATASHSTDIRPLMGKSGDAESGDIGGLGFTDPPVHTRLRRLLTPEFTMRRLERLKPRIGEIIATQLAETARTADADGVVDLAQTFAFPVPFQVICELLGLPTERREEFRSLATARFDITAGGAGAVGAIGGSRDFLLAEVVRQRRDPGPGLIGQIITEHGAEVSDYDLCGLADGAFTGGLETSASMLALGTVVLLEDRDRWRAIAEDPDVVEPMVEELLRHLAVVQVAFPRFVTEDVVLGGRRITKGSVILAHLPGASRDPRATGGARFAPSAESANHLAFGHGLHRCIGAELGRMELRAAYPALAGRFPDLELAVDAAQLRYRPKSLVFGVDSLPVRLG